MIEPQTGGAQVPPRKPPLTTTAVIDPTSARSCTFCGHLPYLHDALVGIKMSLKSNQQMYFVCDSCGKTLILESNEAVANGDPSAVQEQLETWWTVGGVIAADDFEDPNERARHYCSSECVRRAHGG